MSDCPPVVGGARVVCFTRLDRRHRHTGNTLQLAHGQPLPPARALVIARYDGDPQFYLFGCDETWQPCSDTCHESLEAAQEQAEFEFEGTRATWGSVTPRD